MDNEEELLTEKHISEAVQNKFYPLKYTVLNYEKKSVTEKFGLLGQYTIINANVLNEDDNQTEDVSFFVKQFPQTEAVAEFAKGIGAFKKEIFVYDLLTKFRKADINLINSCTVNCYANENNRFLIFENLFEQGYKNLDKHQTLHYNTIIVIIQSLAKFHASSLIYEEKISNEQNIKYRLSDEYEECFEESFFNNKEGFPNLPGVKASIKCILTEIEIFKIPTTLLTGKHFVEIAEEVCLKIYDLVKPSEKYRNVLCHGDLWASNLLISYDENDNTPKECKLVDFQCGRYVPPAMDVLSMIYLTTTKEFRKEHMYQIIGIYYSYLEKYLKVAGYNARNIISFTEFMESCEEYKLFAILQSAFYFPLILIDNDYIEEYFNDSVLNQLALFEDRSYLVLKHMDRDNVYRKRLQESIEDLKDYCDYY